MLHKVYIQDKHHNSTTHLLTGFIYIILVMNCCSVANGQGYCAPQWAEGFHRPEMRSVSSMAVYDDGDGPALYFGGGFDRAWDMWTRPIVKWDGVNWAPVPGEFGPHNPMIEVSSHITTMTLFDDGGGEKLIVAGCFINIDEQVVNGIAEWDGQHWSSLGLGIYPESSCVYPGGSSVRTLTVFDDGNGPSLIVGGSFTNAGDVTVNNIAKWDGQSWSSLDNGTDGVVIALTTFDDGNGINLYTAGNFQAAGGTPANNIAMWDGITWQPLSLGIDGAVFALAVFDDGNGAALYAGGNFTTAEGTTVNYIAKWDGQTWSTLGNGLISGGNYGVRTLEIYDSGNGPELYVGGLFESAGVENTNRFAKWNGVEWSSVSSGLGQFPSYYDSVNSMIVFDQAEGSSLIVAGGFDSAGGTIASGLAQWDGISWSPLEGPTGNGLNHWIFDFEVGDDGNGPGLFAGGRFTIAGGKQINRIGKFDGKTWSPLGSGIDGWFNDMTFYDDGNGNALYATGEFTTAGGVPALNVARWNGNIWESVGDGLGVENETSYGIAIAGHNEGTAANLYVGGFFRVSDNPIKHHIMQWDGSNWIDVGGEVNAFVRTLTFFDDGTGLNLYVGGSFTSVNGIPAKGVARWDGISWHPVGDGISQVLQLEVIEEGGESILYAARRYNISRWDGNQWIDIGTPDGSLSAVHALSRFDDGSGPALYAAGTFYSIDGVTAWNIAKWDGSTWSPLKDQIDIRGAIYDLVVFDDGSGPGLFMGGQFDRAEDTVSLNMAKWYSPPLPCPAGKPIPILSEMGVLVMAILILGLGGVLIRRRVA